MCCFPQEKKNGLGSLLICNLSVYLCVCVPRTQVSGCPLMEARGWQEVSSSVALCLMTGHSLPYDGAHRFIQSGCPASPVILLPPASPARALWVHTAILGFYIASEEWSLGPHACAASQGTTSPNPQLFFETESWYVVHAGLKLLILLLHPPKAWDYPYGPTHSI